MSHKRLFFGKTQSDTCRFCWARTASQVVEWRETAVALVKSESVHEAKHAKFWSLQVST